MFHAPGGGIVHVGHEECPSGLHLQQEVPPGRSWRVVGNLAALEVPRQVGVSLCCQTAPQNEHLWPGKCNNS